VSEASPNRPTTLADYLAILRRRKWPVLVLPLVVAAASYVIVSGESSVYQATAQVLVDRTSIVSAISGVQDPAIGDPTRFLATEASIGRSPVLASRAASASGISGITGQGLLADSSITSEADADILDVSVSSANPSDAVTLANAYATAFTQYKTELDTQKINKALRSLRVRIQSLKKAGESTSIGFSTLVQYQSQLETIGTLLANNTTVLKPASQAIKLRPKPLHAVLLGLLLGGVIGLGVAFLIEGLDRRVRSDSEIEQVLGLPLLGRIPELPPELRDANSLLTVSDAESIQAESFRRLRTRIDLLNLDRGTRRIMFTSAVPREGKSTTVANLAVALAQSGRRVALVDLDLRRPILHEFFQTGVEHGITDIVSAGEGLMDTLQSIPLPGVIDFDWSQDWPSGSQKGIEGNHGRALSFLPAGSASAAGGDALVGFLESPRLNQLLRDLAREYDMVLVDTPPLLTVNDAMALTTRMDAIVLVVHAQIQRPLLVELERQLKSTGIPVLGFIVTGVAETQTGYYGYSAYTSGHPETSMPTAEQT
jgi:polysaccharide biosynthesis transport protein